MDLKEKQKAWALAAQKGDQRAAQKLVHSLMGLVNKNISKLLPSGLSRDDLQAAGLYGIAMAIERFDPKLGTISGLAEILIRSEMIAATKKAGSISVSNSKRSRRLLYKSTEMVARYEAAGKTRSDAIECAASDLGIPSSELLRFFGMKNPVEFHPWMDAGDSLSQEPDPFEEINTEDVRELISLCIDALGEREREVILRRYFSDEFVSFEAIATDWGCSRDLVRRTETSAFGKIRAELKSRGLSWAEVV